MVAKAYCIMTRFFIEIKQKFLVRCNFESFFEVWTFEELKKAVDEKQAELTALQNEYDVRMQEMKDLGASADKINSDNALNKIERNLSVAS